MDCCWTIAVRVAIRSSQATIYFSIPGRRVVACEKIPINISKKCLPEISKGGVKLTFVIVKDLSVFGGKFEFDSLLHVNFVVGIVTFLELEGHSPVRDQIWQ